MLQPLLFSTGWPGTLSGFGLAPYVCAPGTLRVGAWHSAGVEPSTLFGPSSAPYWFVPSTLNRTGIVGGPIR